MENRGPFSFLVSRPTSPVHPGAARSADTEGKSVVVLSCLGQAVVLLLGRLSIPSIRADGATPLRSSCSPHLASAEEVCFGLLHLCLGDLHWISSRSNVSYCENLPKQHRSGGKLNLPLSMTFTYLIYLLTLRGKSGERSSEPSSLCSATSFQPPLPTSSGAGTECLHLLIWTSFT